MFNLEGFLPESGAVVVGFMMMVSALFMIATLEMACSKWWLGAVPRIIAGPWQFIFLFYGWRGFTIIHNPIAAKAAFVWAVMVACGGTLSFCWTLAKAIKKAEQEKAMRLVGAALMDAPIGPGASGTPGPPLLPRPPTVKPKG